MKTHKPVLPCQPVGIQSNYLRRSDHNFYISPGKTVFLMEDQFISTLLILTAIITVCLCGCTQTTDKSGNVVKPAENHSIQTQEKKTYIVGIDGDYHPFSFIDKNGAAQGFDVESVRWIAKKFGFEVKIEPIAWDAIIPALNANTIDMIYSGMTITDKRKEQVSFSNPYWKVNQSVAVHNDSTLTMQDFMAGKGRIGAQRASTGAFWVEENLVNKSLIQPDQLVTNDIFPLVAADLQNKRIDFAIFDQPPMTDAIVDKPLHIIGEIDTGEEYGVAIRKSDTELLNTINKGLDLLKKSPDWAVLKKKYAME